MLRIALVGRNKMASVWTGNYLGKHHGFEHKRLSDPVETFVKRTHWYLGPRKGKAYVWERKLDIYDFFYKMEPDIWVKYVEWRLEKQQKPVVVSDVRYISELEYLRKNLGFKIVRIQAQPKRLENISKSLGKSYAPGTLALAEKYAKDFTATVAADFTFKWDTDYRDEARASIISILDQLDYHYVPRRTYFTDKP